MKFALHHGWLPPEVDHEDRDRRNNTLSNLRAATRQQNGRNKGPYKRKNVGLPRGVRPARAAGRFGTFVVAGDGRNRSLGTFDTAKEASRVVEDFLKELHGDRYCPHPPLEGGE